jgi:hypothetical protein
VDEGLLIYRGSMYRRQWGDIRNPKLGGRNGAHAAGHTSCVIGLEPS